jgi:hypothetical protein
MGYFPKIDDALFELCFFIEAQRLIEIGLANEPYSQMIMVKAHKPIEFFSLYNNVLALEDILLQIVHGHILTNIIYDHGLLMLSCLYILLSSYYVGNKLSI